MDGDGSHGKITPAPKHHGEGINFLGVPRSLDATRPDLVTVPGLARLLRARGLGAYASLAHLRVW